MNKPGSLAVILAAGQDEAFDPGSQLPDMLTLAGYGYGGTLCQPTTAEESQAAAILWATHELATGFYTLH